LFEAATRQFANTRGATRTSPSRIFVTL